MSRIYWKGSALLAPVPSVIVTCGDGERANMITIGWCGVASTRPPRVCISVRPERYSHGIIKETGEFVINLTPSSLARECDYIGTMTGRKIDKAAKTGLTLIPSETVASPTIEQSPLALECKVYKTILLGSHDMFIADVTKVSVDERFVAPDGRLRLDRADLLVFAHGEYFQIGKKIAPIGFSVSKAKKRSSKKNSGWSDKNR